MSFQTDPTLCHDYTANLEEILLPVFPVLRLPIFDDIYVQRPEDDCYASPEAMVSRTKDDVLHGFKLGAPYTWSLEITPELINNVINNRKGLLPYDMIRFVFERCCPNEADDALLLKILRSYKLSQPCKMQCEMDQGDLEEELRKKKGLVPLKAVLHLSAKIQRLEKELDQERRLFDTESNWQEGIHPPLERPLQRTPATSDLADMFSQTNALIGNSKTRHSTSVEADLARERNTIVAQAALEVFDSPAQLFSGIANVDACTAEFGSTTRQMSTRANRDLPLPYETAVEHDPAVVLVDQTARALHASRPSQPVAQHLSMSAITALPSPPVRGAEEASADELVDGDIYMRAGCSTSLCTGKHDSIVLRYNTQH